MDFSYPIHSIQINGKVFNINIDDNNNSDSNLSNTGNDVNGSIYLDAEKKFSYKGAVDIKRVGRVDFEGIGGEWIGLVDDDGNYCGSVCF